MKTLWILLIFFIAPVFADSGVKQSIFFFGYVRHLEVTPQTYEGNMKYFGYSREYRKDNWQLEPGAETYIDSYSLRSYSAFIDISHDSYAYPYFRPTLRLSYMYKGDEYGSDKRTSKLFILPVFRIGGKTKLFMDIIPVPKVGDITNGFIAIKFGYKW